MDVSGYRTTGTHGGGHRLDLASFDCGGADGVDRKKVEKQTRHLLTELVELQEKLFAQGKRRVLVVLQAIDGGGKDSTIQSIFGPLNAAGVNVVGFKQPTTPELEHDYLWRVHPHVPGDGEIVVFNRSQYEEVLVVRVHDLVPKERWERRYGHLQEFERLLTDEGTTIVKLLLMISKDEQAQRMRDRLDDPTKRWKFRTADLEERQHWDDYQDAFQDMIDRTSDVVPWHVIPADHKWFRNRIVAQIMVDTLRSLDLAYPPVEDDLSGVTIT